jgi:serine/threonine-protein kinase HipA
MSDRALPVNLHGIQLGLLTDGDDGRPILRWNNTGPWRRNSAILSRHLRVGVTNSDATTSFFGGLLPEGVHLDRLATAVQTSTTDLVGMFAAVGADLAGALTVGQKRQAGEPTALTTSEVRELLRAAPGFLVGGGGSALPGFQRKLTLTRQDNRWVRGNGQIASTHILKPVTAELRRVVEAESYALAITRQVGLSPFDAWVEELDDLAVLVIERYDLHRTASGTIERIHQEDFAQALGLPPHGDHKFEWHEPRANLAAIAAQVDADATIFTPGTDRARLLQYVTANIALGNTDAHAKNFSLLHDEQGGTRLAPLYDIAPLALAYNAGDQLAMNVNGHRHQADVTVADLIAEAGTWGIDASRARETVDGTLNLIIEATKTIPAHASIEAHIPGYIRQQTQNLLSGAKARITSHVPLMMLPRLGTPTGRIEKGVPEGGQYTGRNRPESEMELE